MRQDLPARGGSGRASDVTQHGSIWSHPASIAPIQELLQSLPALGWHPQDLSTAALLLSSQLGAGVYRGSVLPVAPPAAPVLALCHSPTLMLVSRAPWLLYQFGVNLADLFTVSCS